jgi:hypothetical protein
MVNVRVSNYSKTSTSSGAHEKKISDLLDIRKRFLRSANLERDFDDPTAIGGYVATKFTRSCFERLADGLKPKSGQRAWRMTGDYGSGKSSFALLLAHAFAAQKGHFSPEVRKIADFRKFGGGRPGLIPVLLTCSRQPLNVAILQALHRTLTKIYGQGTKSKLLIEIQRLLETDHGPGDDIVVGTLIKASSQILADSKGRGLLLILDELGKFLEFAALNPQQQDVFLLQRIAEAASRSGDKPLFVICLLHQGFNAYAEHLDQSAQREWEKVAGRFEEIIFNQPIEQLAYLIASALNIRTKLVPKTLAAYTRKVMHHVTRLGWFGAAPADDLVELADRLFPLHPTVLPVLIRTFRRFGQNERSLFSFLFSNEPFGLQVFSETSLRHVKPYRLYDLYDYVRSNFGHRLSVLSYRSHWSLIDSVVESFGTEDDLKIKILKTVGILNLLNDADLVATEESVVCALADDGYSNKKRVQAALEELRRGRRVLYDRGRVRGLCLWPHTSVDLEKAWEDAHRAVGMSDRVASYIRGYLEERPIVARRHYIETGNLRHYDVCFSPVSDLDALLQQDHVDSDGLIIIPLCETMEERKMAIRYANRPEFGYKPNWLVGVPQPLCNLASLVQEVQRWEWVISNTPELNADKYAREEVSRQKQAACAHLERQIQTVVGLRQITIQNSLDWFHQGHVLKIKGGRNLLETLSSIFDATYADAPHIQNELVNRRHLSSAAAAARMRLIERMFTMGAKPLLGLDPEKKPPEMSMYLSVLRNTGIHQEHDDGWRIGEPDQKSDVKCHVLPAVHRIREIVQREPDSRVNLAAIFEELRKPPFGVRDGLIPLLLTVFALVHEQDVAFYKDGTFLREMNAESMLVLTKTPEKFEIQYCRVEGVRAEIFEKLLAVLEIKPANRLKVELLDVVKPLCVFVAQLPTFALNSKKLSPVSLAVRDVILNAREPARLLFMDLPKACGYEAFSADAPMGKPVQVFVKTLKEALDELRAAYPELQDRLRRRLREAFDLPGNFRQFRITLAGRAEEIILNITEPKLKAFCLRLMDDNLPETDWLESLGSYLALKPPSKWNDAEEDIFGQELAQLAIRFHRIESIVFVDGKLPRNSVGVRLAITQASGVEHEQVIHFAVEEEEQLHGLQAQFEALLSENRRLGLAAASRALWATLERGGKAKNG